MASNASVIWLNLNFLHRRSKGNRPFLCSSATETSARLQQVVPRVRDMKILRNGTSVCGLQSPSRAPT